MKRHLQCAAQKWTPSKLTKYCACHAKWISWLIRITYETSFTMRGATVHTLQPHQILRLPTQNESHDGSASHYETSFTMRGATVNTLQTSPNTAPATQNESHMDPQHIWNVIYNARSNSPHPPTLPILYLPRKMNLMIDPHHIWNAIYNARSNSPHPPTSPNLPPATQNESHDWSASHMKRHLQCAEQQSTPSDLTKYCACHANDHPTSHRNYLRTAWNVIYNARPIRAWSENDPTPENANRNPPRHRGYFSRSPGADSLKLQRFTLRLSFQISPNAAPATKTNTCELHKYRACHAKWISWLIHITYETSFTMRRATVHTLRPHQILRLPRKMESHDWSTSHMKRHLQCAEMFHMWCGSIMRFILRGRRGICEVHMC